MSTPLVCGWPMLGVLVCVALIGASRPALAQPDQTAVAVRQPDGVFTFRGDTRIQDIVLAPEGTHAYAIFQIGSVNLWAVLVFFWPEITATLVTLCIGVALWRVLRRRRRLGEPHCRRCNYLLTNLSGDRCPECGFELTEGNRVIGQPRRWKIAALLVLMVMTAAGYLTAPRTFPARARPASGFNGTHPGCTTGHGTPVKPGSINARGGFIVLSKSTFARERL